MTVRAGGGGNGKWPLVFGDRIFEDDNHRIIPSIREIDGEERFKDLA